ncbi:MAG TPA: Flp pilus assembly protein CpaB [Candidatus Polarisedimenticolia bacterium]|nr:Flp pilus assembly protein CpaB [Candidatus Polarisedimenticolia bacterium]
MRRIFVISILILAIGSGGAASILTYRILKNRQMSDLAGGPKPAPTFPMVVAAVKLPYGTVLQAEHVKTMEWASTVRPEGSFSDPQAVLGRAITEGVVPGEPVLEGRLAPRDAGGGLASVIPKGKRAVSVRVNEIIGVAGFVLPRTRVDVLVSVNPGGEKGRSASKMILQNVEVLAAGQKIEQDAEGKPETVNVITLLVNPEEAEKLTLASHEGELQLALRNSLDLDSVTTGGANLSAMVQGTRREPVRIRTEAPGPRPPAAPTVEVIRGSKRTTESF